MAARRLIVTADDLGISSEVNEGVVQAHRRGLLRFASLMVAGDAAGEAVERVREESPGLGIGLHLVLCRGRSVLAPAHLGGLVDEQGKFPDDPVACGLRYFFDASLQAPLERELRAQFERFLSFGFAPGHVDGHLNIHAHPVVFPLAVRLAREYGFTRVRLPGGEFWRSAAYSWRPALKQVAEGSVFSLLRRYLSRAFADPRVEIVDRTYGLLRSGMMKEAYLLSLLAGLPEGTTEVYFHPSADPATAVTQRPTAGHHTFTELEALTSPSVRALLEREGVELVSPPRD